MGGKNVVDVVGKIFEGTSLADVFARAVANANLTLVTGKVAQPK